MNKRLWLVLLLLFALALAACGGQQPPVEEPVEEPAVEEPVAEEPVAEEPAAEEPAAEEPAEEPMEEPTEEPMEEEPTEEPMEEEPAEEPAEEEQAAATGGAFHGAWPYTAPPAGHFNTWVTDGILGGSPYLHLVQPALFMYMWADDDWMPMAGESWEMVDDTTLRVTLPAGAVWSDGSPYTSQDIVDTFTISRLLNQAVWSFIDGVEAVDETTVDFSLIQPSTVVPRRVLRETYIRPSSTYGEFANRTRELVDQGLTPESEEWAALVEEFTAFRPDDMVALGPFRIDPASITESQMTLNKVPTSFMADWVNFDTVVLYNGETPDVTPLVLAGDVDYATHGFPPATEQEFIAQGIRILRAPNYNGPALYFNQSIHPFELPEFRQAVAYVIDRAENGFVSLAESGRAVEWMAGFSDNLVDLWLTDETMEALNVYPTDTAMAEQILTDLGFTRDADGVWLDDTGARLEFELTAPAEFADWSAAAENVAQQLTAFGIPTTFRGVPFQQHPIDVRAGDFELAIRDWGAGNPHPHFAYNTNFNAYNQTGTDATTAGPGMQFDAEQETSMGTVDVVDLTIQAGTGGSIEEQRDVVNQLALIYNELLPQIPLWERYGNNPAQEIRVTGWPPDEDPVYRNGTYSDPFVIVLLLNGTLEPVE